MVRMILAIVLDFTLSVMIVMMMTKMIKMTKMILTIVLGVAAGCHPLVGVDGKGVHRLRHWKYFHEIFDTEKYEITYCQGARRKDLKGVFCWTSNFNIGIGVRWWLW